MHILIFFFSLSLKLNCEYSFNSVYISPPVCSPCFAFCTKLAFWSYNKWFVVKGKWQKVQHLHECTSMLQVFWHVIPHVCNWSNKLGIMHVLVTPSNSCIAHILLLIIWVYLPSVSHIIALACNNFYNKRNK